MKRKTSYGLNWQEKECRKEREGFCKALEKKIQGRGNKECEVKRIQRRNKGKIKKT